MATKKCSKCSIVFECISEKEGCWCESLTINVKTLNALKEQYNNCLCPACLKEYSVVSENK